MSVTSLLSRNNFFIELNCPVCHDHYRDPKILPCNHTLCGTPCLERLLESNNTATCPACSLTHSMPTEGIRDYPNNVAVTLMLKANLADFDTEPGCPTCGKPGELHECCHCQQCICCQCLRQHASVYHDDVAELSRRVVQNADDAFRERTATEEEVMQTIKQTTDAVDAQIDAAIDRAVSMLHQKAKDLKAVVQRERQKKMESVSKNSRYVRQGWQHIAGYSRAVLNDLDNANGLSSVQLQKISEKLLKEQDRIDRLIDESVNELDFDMEFSSSLDYNLDEMFELRILPEEPDATSPEREQLSFEDYSEDSLTSKKVCEPSILTSALSDSDIKVRFASAGSNDKQLFSGEGITVDDRTGNVFIVDTYNHRIEKYDSRGKRLLCFGSRGSGLDQFFQPWSVAITRDNRMVISDTGNNRLKLHNEDGSINRIIENPLGEHSLFDYPRGIALDRNGHINVCDSNNKHIKVLHPDGTTIRQATVDWCPNPWYTSINSNGDICVVGYAQCAVVNATFETQEYKKSWGLGYQAGGVCTVGDAHVLISDTFNNKLRMYDLKGQMCKVFDGAGCAAFRSPRGLAVDKHGDFYVACEEVVLKF